MESLSDDQALNWPKNWLVLNVWSVKRRVENTLLSQSILMLRVLIPPPTILLLWPLHYSSEIKGLRSMKCSSKMFQNLISILLFSFFYFVQLYSSLMNVGAHVFINPCILREISLSTNVLFLKSGSELHTSTPRTMSST